MQYSLYSIDTIDFYTCGFCSITFTVDFTNIPHRSLRYSVIPKYPTQPVFTRTPQPSLISGNTFDDL